EGSLRVMAGRVRITVHLIDGLTNHHIWTERYDRTLAEISALQDDITDRVASAIEPQLYLSERLHAERKSLNNLSAWECIVRALSQMSSKDKHLVAGARELLKKAILIDPNSSQAYSLSFIM